MTVSKKFWSVSILCCLLCGFTVFLSGCALLEKREKVQIEEVPPHYGYDTHYRNPNAGFHDPKKDPSVNDPKFIKNKQMLALEQEIDEEKLDKAWDEDYEATMQRREKMKFWKDWSWFQSGDSTTGMSKEAKAISQRLDRQ